MPFDLAQAKTPGFSTGFAQDPRVQQLADQNNIREIRGKASLGQACTNTVIPLRPRLPQQK